MSLTEVMNTTDISAASIVHNHDSVNELKVINGMSSSALTERQKSVVAYYYKQGRKHGIALSMISEAPQDELFGAKSAVDYDAINSKYPHRITVYGLGDN